jgi:hypothetical protein
LIHVSAKRNHVAAEEASSDSGFSASCCQWGSGILV